MCCLWFCFANSFHLGPSIGPKPDAVDALHVIPEVIQVLQLHPVLLALGMLAEYQIVVLQSLHLLQVLTIEVVVHDGQSTVQEHSLLVRHALVPNAARTLRLAHKKGEQVWSGRPRFYDGVGLRLLHNASSFQRLSLVVQGGHQLGRPDAEQEEVRVV